MAHQRVVQHIEVTLSDCRHYVRSFPTSITRNSSSIRLKEDPGQPHWYDSVFDNDVVQGFIRRHTGQPTTRFVDERSIEGILTLTVAVPAESDSLCGLRIEKLSTPGRYGPPDIGGFPTESLRRRFITIG